MTSWKITWFFFGRRYIDSFMVVLALGFLLFYHTHGSVEQKSTKLQENKLITGPITFHFLPGCGWRDKSWTLQISADCSGGGPTQAQWREISVSPIPILVPYHSHKTPLKYGTGMGSLWEEGPTIWGSLGKSPKQKQQGQRDYACMRRRMRKSKGPEKPSKIWNPRSPNWVVSLNKERVTRDAFFF